ncbi:MAG: hypothetical protein K6F98_05525 [Bacteroidales bacterium]|nr:hypothetical protein [Bacteroidales bacterium]
MKSRVKELEEGALLYVQKEIDDRVIGVKFVGTRGSTSYFDPSYRMSLAGSNGGPHLITFKDGQYGITFSPEEIEPFSDVLF